MWHGPYDQGGCTTHMERHFKEAPIQIKQGRTLGHHFQRRTQKVESQNSSFTSKIRFFNLSLPLSSRSYMKVTWAQMEANEQGYKVECTLTPLKCD